MEHNLDIEYTIPIKINPSISVDSNELKQLLLSATDYSCPECGTTLLMEKRYIDMAIFYCPRCKKNIKAKLMEIN